jgi:hypothetical protein
MGAVKVDLVNTPELLLLKSINNNVEKKETPTVPLPLP